MTVTCCLRVGAKKTGQAWNSIREEGSTLSCRLTEQLTSLQESPGASASEGKENTLERQESKSSPHSGTASLVGFETGRSATATPGAQGKANGLHTSQLAL